MLQGKVAVVTGGTGALGEAVVAAFLEAGARVAVVSRSGPTAEAVARPDVLWLAADVLNTHSMSEAVAQTAARFGQVDILAHLVGSWYGGSVAETPLARWREQL
ncbi:MAG: SDR family NAD(P)-dependent oxidoreductase, partial [Chloroflexi bacterium]|nr:SDR family NAD(P)-dependent oxidoreductase [Chloroflexota bacterium]